MAVTSPPDKITVARRLDADPEHLEQFVTSHPDPTADVVLRSRVTPQPPRRVAEDTRALLAAWIEHRKGRQRDDPRYQIIEYLREHGPTPELELADLVASGPDGTARNDGFNAVLSLEQGGYIYTPDDEDGRVYRLCDDTSE